MTLRLFAALAAFLPALALAHTSGFSVETRVGESLLDFGCEADRLMVGTETYCSVGLIENPDSGKPILDLAEYDSVRLIMTPLKEAEPMIDITAESKQGLMTFLPILPTRAGVYMLELRVMNGGKIVAQSRSVVNVLPPDSVHSEFIAAGLLTIMVGFAAAGMYRKQR